MLEPADSIGVSSVAAWWTANSSKCRRCEYGRRSCQASMGHRWSQWSEKPAVSSVAHQHSMSWIQGASWGFQARIWRLSADRNWGSASLQAIFESWKSLDTRVYSSWLNAPSTLLPGSHTPAANFCYGPFRVPFSSSPGINQGRSRCTRPQMGAGT